MPCASCNGDVIDNPFGPWCDTCGGVAIRPDVVIFRHVATVKGPGGAFAVVYDLSSGDYAYIHKNPNPPNNTRDMDGFKRPSVRMSHGSLDAMIALSYADVVGDGDGELLLAPAPSATEVEMALINRGF